MGWTAGVRSPSGVERDFSLLVVQTGHGAYPAFYPMGTGGSFMGGKAVVCISKYIPSNFRMMANHELERIWKERVVA
jgi:hypothetical protein